MMEKIEQPDLDGFLQAEAEAREADIPYDAWLSHKKNMALRWFKYYKMNKDPKKKCDLVRQYNRIACIKDR